MSRMSLKLKITLWYSLIMLVVSGIVLTVMTSISKEMLSRDMEGRIVRAVTDLSRKMEGPGGRTDSIPKFGFYEQGVHMAIYDNNYNPVGGQIPFEFADTSGFSNNKLSVITDNGNQYYVYTKVIRRGGSAPFWIKGVMSVSLETMAIQSAAHTNLVLTVILLAIAAAGGYFITKRALAPVNKISRTAKEISESSDLSQRIHIGSGTDEIHCLANTFDEMLDKIEQTLEREKQFTSDASHELRTPVAVILSECEYMTDCAKSYDEIKEAAFSVKCQAEKMSKLISGLLTISRMDKNTLQTEFEQLDVSELLGFVCDEQEEIHPDHIALHRKIEPGITVFADRFLLARLFINLISNAYNYGRTGGNITVSLVQENEKMILRVADDGIGIAEEYLPKIWERFYQVDPSRTADKTGSIGLGLSMVKWIADCHNGTVDVTSEPGRGSVFTFQMEVSRGQ